MDIPKSSPPVNIIGISPSHRKDRFRIITSTPRSSELRDHALEFWLIGAQIHGNPLFDKSFPGVLEFPIPYLVEGIFEYKIWIEDFWLLFNPESDTNIDARLNFRDFPREFVVKGIDHQPLSFGQLLEAFNQALLDYANNDPDRKKIYEENRIHSYRVNTFTKMTNEYYVFTILFNGF